MTPRIEEVVVLPHLRPSRQPMPVLAYLASAIMAWLYITDTATARSLATAADSQAATLWQYTLLIGSTLGLLGVALPRRHVINALLIEAAGAAILALEVGIYIGAVATADSSTKPWATLVWIGMVIPLGLAARTVEAYIDRGRRLFIASIEAA